MSVRLPLFPLGGVLFPGELLPLHVFEERYRRLVLDLLGAPEDSRRFAVVSIREGREVGSDGVRALHDVGCIARVRRVEPYDDGRFDVVGSGAQRFRLLSVDDSLPYLTAEVDLLDEPGGELPAAVVPAVRRLFATYRAALGGGDVELPDEPCALSYLISSAAVLEAGEKQRLLASPDTAARLRHLLRLLHRETTLFGVLPSLPGVELTRVAASQN